MRGDKGPPSSMAFSISQSKLEARGSAFRLPFPPVLFIDDCWVRGMSGVVGGDVPWDVLNDSLTPAYIFEGLSPALTTSLVLQAGRQHASRQ